MDWSYLRPPYIHSSLAESFGHDALKKVFFTALSALLLWVLTFSASHAASHGVALYDEPKYKADFKHFEYVNPDAPKSGELRLASIGTFDSVNPFILKGMAADGSGLVFSTLMEASLDEPFSQYGLVAESVEIAKDRSWVSYVLRKEATFHDGSPITPDDVVFSFETLRDKGHPSYRIYYKDVVKAEKMGEREVKFTFKTAGNTELPLIVGQLPVLSKKYWADKDFSATTMTPIVGSGPYKIENLTAGRTISYSRVKDWWGKDLPVNKGRYNFDAIKYDYYRDATVALEALFSGRYDFRFENIAKNWATEYNTPAVKEGYIRKQEIKNELPSGMQGFVFNTRREVFKDKRVREALGYAFDFEWSNKNVAFGAYKRTASYFSNSELAATGLPSAEELKILNKYRDKLPPEVFTTEFKPPSTDGSGDNRENLKKAAEMLRQSGWTLKNGKLFNEKGEQLKFEIVDQTPLFERWVQPFLRNLERLGVEAKYRIVDASQYQSLMDNLDFDMTIHVFPQSLSPGNEQRDFWTSQKAEQKGTRNLAGVRDGVVDDLVDKLVHAKDRKSLVTICHALDRVLLWGHYVIPHWYYGAFRLAYWDMFGQPQISPKYGLAVMDSWWVDKEKFEKTAEKQKRGR